LKDRRKQPKQPKRKRETKGKAKAKKPNSQTNELTMHKMKTNLVWDRI
jgi:hypothetical protein